LAFKIFVGALLVFALGNLIFFLVSPLRYHLSLRGLRKGLYTLFVGAISLGLLLDEVKLSNWQFLLTLTGIIIFVDLAILLTPSIMKIWNAEFQYSDYVENVIKTNDKIHKGTMMRVQSMSEMIQNAGNYFEDFILDPDDRMRRIQLEEYLELYSEQYGFDIQLWDYHPSLELNDLLEERSNEEIDDLIDSSHQRQLKEVLERIARLNSFELGESKESYVESLYNSEIISLIDEDSMIVPVYMNEENLLVVLKNTKGELLEVDAVHITNLIYLFHSFD